MFTNPRSVAWICTQCAVDAGAKPYWGHLATFHEDVCSICQEERFVTEPRDFDWRGYLSVNIC